MDERPQRKAVDFARRADVETGDGHGEVRESNEWLQWG